jgi:hypothetical protein
MKKAFVAVFVLGLTTIGTDASVLSQRRVNVAQARVQQQRPAAAARGGMLPLIQGMYINQLQRQTEITDDQFVKIVPFLRQYVAERSEIDGPRRIAARRQLNQAVMRGASDEELTPLIEQFDRVDAELQESQIKFLRSVDPLLNIRQRARLRVHLMQTEERIRRLIQESQNPTPAGQTPQRPNRPSQQ